MSSFKNFDFISFIAGRTVFDFNERRAFETIQVTSANFRGADESIIARRKCSHPAILNTGKREQAKLKCFHFYFTFDGCIVSGVL